MAVPKSIDDTCMAVCKQDRAQKDYMSNPIPTYFFKCTMLFPFLTLGVHAQQGLEYLSCVCVCVCVSVCPVGLICRLVLVDV